jgi:hypothetical protein
MMICMQQAEAGGETGSRAALGFSLDPRARLPFLGKGKGRYGGGLTKRLLLHTYYTVASSGIDQHV